MIIRREIKENKKYIQYIYIFANIYSIDELIYINGINRQN